MKFSHKYILKKDTPIYKAGWPLKWSGREKRFYFLLASQYTFDEGKPGIYLDRTQSFTLEQIQKIEWFEPDGELVDFIPAFPAKGEIDEYVDLLPTLNYVEDVDQSRAIKELIYDKDFQTRLYEFYRTEYDRFYNQNLESEKNGK